MSPTATITTAYNARALRTTLTDCFGGTQTYAYDGEDIYLEVDETNTVQARYAHGDRVDNPLAFERIATAFPAQ